MKVLSIAYKGKEFARQRVSSPLILIGRSPLCEILLRAPGVRSVHFILEWIGEGEFRSESAFRDEWVLTEVEKIQNDSEKIHKKTTKGQGQILHEKPSTIRDFTFSWVNDRLFESDLDKKIISQQVQDMETPNLNAKNSAPCVLEVISINSKLNSVSDVQHFSFLKSSEWQTPVLNQFSAFPQVQSGVRSANLTLPKNYRSQLIHQGKRDAEFNEKNITLFLHDILHVEGDDSEYYFRVVPKVIGPVTRRAIWSDPFYLISVFCIIIGAFGFFLVFNNVKNEEQTIVVPPRIAQIEVLETVKPKEIEKQETAPPREKETLPDIELPPEKVEKVVEKKPDESGMKKEAEKIAVQKIAPISKVEISAPDSKKVKNAPKVVDKNKGSLDIPAEKAPVNKTGFLAAIKKNKKVGMVKADQIINNGLVADTVQGDKADFVLSQSQSGIVNNRYNKSGDALSAASTKSNMKDTVGSGSLNAGRGNVLKEGFKANYGISGEGGLSGNADFGSLMEAQVEGGLDRASVQSAIRGYKSEIRTCYERALIVKAGVGGRVAYKFQITPSGKVEWINVHKNDVSSGTLVNCVQNVVKNIVFPKAKNGNSTIVIYPFQFERKSGSIKR